MSYCSCAEQVSNPSHPEYGKYLSIDQIARLVAPDPSVQKGVERWLQSQGMAKFAWFRSGDAVRVWCTKETAERAFSVQLAQFVQVSTGRRITRSLVKVLCPVTPFLSLEHRDADYASVLVLHTRKPSLLN